MSTLIVPAAIRLACDMANPFNSIIDLYTNGPAQFVAGDDIQFDLGIFENGSLVSQPLSQTGAGGIASITMQLFLTQNDTFPAQIAATTTTLNTTLTTAQWNAGSAAATGGSANAHASFLFSNTVTAISLNSNPPVVLAGQTSAQLWLRAFITTSDASPRRITIAEGQVTVKNGPLNANVATSPANGVRFSNVNGVVVLQMYDPIGGQWHTVNILNQSGLFTLQVSDQGYQ